VERGQGIALVLAAAGLAACRADRPGNPERPAGPDPAVSLAQTAGEPDPAPGEGAGGGAGDWQVLFDGRSLSGWTSRGGRYDGAALWIVEDGAITGVQGPRGEGGLLYTEGIYADFELELEARVGYPFDSGIFLRMQPPASGLKGIQVTIDNRPDGEVGALYADGFLTHNQDAKARFRRGEWNHFRVRCRGEDFHVEAWMNGEKIADHRFAPGAAGFARSGRIGLQVHGGLDVTAESKAQFRALRLRRFSDSPGG